MGCGKRLRENHYLKLSILYLTKKLKKQTIHDKSSVMYPNGSIQNLNIDYKKFSSP
jgi:hypothetical protein